MKTETKVLIYKNTIRPTLTYAAETRPETSRTQQIIEATEMRILRKIARKSLLYREGVKISNEPAGYRIFMLGRKIEWNDRITRMTDDQTVKAT